MCAGDKDVAIVMNSMGFDMTGYTATLFAAPGEIVLGNALTLTPVTISDNGLTATYTTTGTDFEQAGPWQLQLQVALGDALYTSPPTPLYIFPKL
jgi:hypothetical protein